MWPFKTMSKRQSLHMQAMNAEMTNRLLLTIARSMEEHVQMQREMRKETREAVEMVSQKQDSSNDLVQAILPMAIKMFEDASGAPVEKIEG